MQIDGASLVSIKKFKCFTKLKLLIIRKVVFRGLQQQMLVNLYHLDDLHCTLALFPARFAMDNTKSVGMYILPVKI